MRGRALLALLAVAICIGIALASRSRRRHLVAGPPASTGAGALFVDVTRSAGIDFHHHSGAIGRKFMPETVGSGVGFIDFDNDGRLDILYVNCTDWPTSPHPTPHYPILYHNNGDGTFTDVTAKAGLKIDVYGMGVAVGDYDNDGWSDIYLTCIGPNHLFHNNHDGTFTDVTSKAGVAGTPVEPGGIRWKWSSSAAWCDFDRDGVPDLFVCNYVKWTPKTDVFCTSRSGEKAYCAPVNFEGVSCTLYRGRGDGTFEDVSARMGILSRVGKSLGVVVADVNGDGWPDILVTNDTSANFLFINDHGKLFHELGSEAGIAYPDTGIAKAGMGIDVADFQNNGKAAIVTGNFSKECLSLYTNDGTGLFRDQAYPLGVAQPSLTYLTFGLFFFDYDLDGRQDIFTANGHIDNYIHESDAMITYRERPLLYHNSGSGFTEVGAAAGIPLRTPLVGRGCAWGDYDLDGAPDIAIVSNNVGGYLWHNSTPHGSGWIGLKLRGTRSTRDAWGAQVRITAGNTVQTREISGGGGFLSQHQIWPLFGLNGAESVDRVQIDWPSGEKSELTGLAAGHYYQVVEGEKRAVPITP